MLYSEAQRRPSGYPSSTVVVAALAHLRERTFPRFVEPPRFISRTRALPSQTEALMRFVRGLTHPRVLIAAGVLALAILVATSISALAALQPNSSTASLPQVLSSASTTGTAATRVEDLSAATFVGGSPFFSQAQYLSASEGSLPQALIFLKGAQEAPVTDYMRQIGTLLVLPGINNTLEKQHQVQQWVAAQEAQRQVALTAAAPTTSAPVWQGNLPAGARISGAYVTFYACVGNGFCGNTASGAPAQPGVAACSYNLPFGTRFVVATDPTQRVFTCLDRGAIGPTWVDIWFYDVADGYAWQAAVGTHSDIIIVN
ncbi:MAG: hypothetical protein WBD55_08410 [Dehalococcoidia bacterium]